MRNDKSKKPKAISKAEFARAIGISPQNLHYHLKHSDKAPPIGDVDGWATFLAGEGRDSTLPPKLREAIARERLRLMEENVKKVKMENEEKQGELISFAKVRSFMHRVIGDFFFGELERLAHELPATMKGQDEVTIHAEIKTQTSKIKERLTEHIQAWDKKKV